MQKCLENVLRGRKFKKLLDLRSSRIRKKYDLKQIEIDILYYVGMSEEIVTATKLCKELELNKGQVSIAMDRLATLGFLTIEPSGEDKRLIYYKGTEKATLVFQDIQQVTNEVKDRLFAGITKKQEEVIMSAVNQLVKNMDELISEENKSNK